MSASPASHSPQRPGGRGEFSGEDAKERRGGGRARLVEGWAVSVDVEFVYCKVFEESARERDRISKIQGEEARGKDTFVVQRVVVGSALRYSVYLLYCTRKYKC
jgi:hypothetical protein